MSFRHVVMFRWAEGVGEDHVGTVASGLDGLAATIDIIREFRHGADARINDGNFDYAVVVDFDSPEDYLTYRDHPDHVAFVAQMISGHVSDRAAVQYSVAD